MSPPRQSVKLARKGFSHHKHDIPIFSFANSRKHKTEPLWLRMYSITICESSSVLMIKCGCFFRPKRYPQHRKDIYRVTIVVHIFSMQIMPKVRLYQNFGS